MNGQVIMLSNTATHSTEEKQNIPQSTTSVTSAKAKPPPPEPTITFNVMPTSSVETGSKSLITKTKALKEERSQLISPHFHCGTNLMIQAAISTCLLIKEQHLIMLSVVVHGQLRDLT